MSLQSVTSHSLLCEALFPRFVSETHQYVCRSACLPVCDFMATSPSKALTAALVFARFQTSSAPCLVSAFSAKQLLANAGCPPLKNVNSHPTPRIGDYRRLDIFSTWLLSLAHQAILRSALASSSLRLKTFLDVSGRGAFGCTRALLAHLLLFLASCRCH